MRPDTVIIAIAIATLIGAYVFYGISVGQLPNIQVALTMPPS